MASTVAISNLDNYLDESDSNFYEYDEGDATDVPEEGNPGILIDPVVANQCDLTHKKSVCNVGVGNCDLGHITTIFTGDPLESRPCDFVF